MNAIGAKYSDALLVIDTPQSETYLPWPDAGMNCSEIYQGITVVDTFIALWKKRLNQATSTLIPSKTTIANIYKIIQNLQEKKKQYNEYAALCEQQAVEQAQQNNSGSEQPEQVQAGSNKTILLLGLGVVGFMIAKKRGLI